MTKIYNNISKKVVHMTTVHPVFDVRIFQKECIGLSSAGFTVILIAPHERNEIVDGVYIVGLGSREGRFKRFFLQLPRSLKLALREDASIYHIHDPELLTIGFLLFILGKKVIYDVHEDLPEQIRAKKWIPHFLRKIVSFAADKIEILSCFFLTGIVAATPNIAERFNHKNKIIVKNFPIIKEFETANFCPYKQRENNLVYIGGLTAERGVREIVQSLKFLETRNLRLKLAGNFNDNVFFKSIANIDSWESVDYLGWLDRVQIASLLSKSKIGLVLLNPVKRYMESYPVKLFEYMAAGIPIIASNFQQWEPLVEDTNSGLLVDPLNTQEIANAISWLLDHEEEAESMGKCGQEAVKIFFNWNNESKKLVKMYKNLNQ